MNGWLIFLSLVAAYILFVYWLLRSGKMEKWNLSLMLGFILMIRTQRGRTTIDKIATPKRAWQLFGDLGILVTFAGMAVMAVLMVIVMWISIQPDSGVEALSASEILVIPGLNPFLPLWYGIAALIITLVVHEGGHGILARANDLKVKSLGLLFAIVPIGAFVEPDEQELTETSRRKRLRVFAAGPMVNIVVALLCIGGFAGMMTSTEAVPGVGLLAVGGPSLDAGLEPGDSILMVGNITIGSVPELSRAIDGYEVGDTATVTLASGAQHDVTVGSRWDHGLSDQQRAELATNDPARAEALQADPYFGIQMFDQGLYRDVATGPLDRIQNFLFFVSLPIQEVRSVPILGFSFPEFLEPSFNPEAFWIIANLLFWTFWVNLMVGLTNILPLLPLDGGHMFRDGVASIVERVRPKIEAAKRDLIVSRASRLVGTLMFVAIILQFVGPRIAPLFG